MEGRDVQSLQKINEGIEMNGTANFGGLINHFKGRCFFVDDCAISNIQSFFDNVVIICRSKYK